MNPHFLRTLVAVARTGSFSVAAAQLGYTQSAVSQHIATLESELGLALLERRPVRPTAAGERLLEHSRPILLRLDAARADVVRLAEQAPVSLRLGASPLAALPRLSAALEQVRRDAPRLEASVRVTDRASVATAVATAELDAGVIDGFAAPTDPLRLPEGAVLSAVAISEEPLCVVLPTDHPLAGSGVLALEQLGEARWIDAPDVCGDLAQLRRVTGITTGFQPVLRYDGCDIRGLLALVAAGHGVVLAPEGAAEGLAPVRIDGTRLVHRTEVVRIVAGVNILAASLLDALSD